MSALTVVVILATLATLSFLVWVTVRSIDRERQAGQRVWPQFALGLALLTLFGVTWISHGLAQWEVFRQEQQMHGEPVVISEFVNEFGQSTLENWQSEFLQLFTMVVLGALFIYRGSAESRDSQDRIEQKLDSLLQAVGVAGTAGPPPKGANKPEWIDYAVSQGADPEEASTMTKDDLIEEYGE